MVISVIGDVSNDLWAAADVLGCRIVCRSGDSPRVSVLVLGHTVADNVVWDSYYDLVGQLRAVKRDAYEKGML